MPEFLANIHSNPRRHSDDLPRLPKMFRWISKVAEYSSMMHQILSPSHISFLFVTFTQTWHLHVVLFTELFWDCFVIVTEQVMPKKLLFLLEKYWMIFQSPVNMCTVCVAVQVSVTWTFPSKSTFKEPCKVSGEVGQINMISKKQHNLQQFYSHFPSYVHKRHLSTIFWYAFFLKCYVNSSKTV